MPHLIRIFTNVANETHRMLLAKTADCISLVGCFYGMDKFRKHVQVVIIYTTFLLFQSKFILLDLTYIFVMHEINFTGHGGADIITKLSQS
jgi:hypothetical protein